jgi:mRNA-degrading endonuclease YafQ of YafQ-DinJ toxin-antitoxin module
MEFLYSNRFKKDYKKLPDNIKKILQEKLNLMAQNPFHPSLRTKKIRGKSDIFECSINMSIRMTWQYQDKKIFLRTVGPHDFTLDNP